MDVDAPRFDSRDLGSGMTDMAATTTRTGRRPVEAIEQRNRRSAECEQRVRRAVTKLVKTGAPFTVENVCDLAGVGKTFIYDKRHPELTKLVLTARDTSRTATASRAVEEVEAASASWRERALNAEAVAKTLRATLKDRDTRITALTGQLYDADGTHLADENVRLQKLIVTMNTNLQRTHQENASLRRSLEAARANVKRERERNVAQLFPQA
jgi:hypothetical protein